VSVYDSFTALLVVGAGMSALGVALLIASDNLLVRWYGRCLVIGGALLLMVPFLVGCSSPTEPSEASEFRWDITAQGCTPAANPPKVSAQPDAYVHLGTYQDVRLATWVVDGKTLTAWFAPFGPIYALCSWEIK